MEASPSRSDSFARGWLGCKARLDADAGAGASCLGHSFGSSTSFIDIDPEELFSMRWTSSVAAEEMEMEMEEEEEVGFDFDLPCGAGSEHSSPLLIGAGHLLVPYEPSRAARADGCTAYADVWPGSSPAFHSAQSTPASTVSSSFHSAQSTPASAVRSSRRVGVSGAVKASAQPLLATRRILLRYLRFLAPLCRKARALPQRVFAPRSSRSALVAATSSSSARQSTSSYASAAEYWCHGHADTAVRDAILHCKKSIQAEDM